MEKPATPPRTDDTIPPRYAFLGVLARLYWMLLGNGALGFTAAAIAQGRGSGLGRSDALFCGVAASLAVIRLVDVVYLGGTTAEGEPASLRHWIRYSAVLVPVSLGIWALARAVRHWGVF